MVLFDLNHVAYRCLFACQRDIKSVGWAYFKHAMYNTIFNMCQKFEAEEVILCVDSKENWRKKIYPEYKETRKEKREAQEDIDWSAFFTAFTEFVAEIKAFFPFYVLQVKYMEADDIAGVLARVWQTKEKIVITSDGDYLQLLRYPKIKVFDPIKNRFLACDDPLRHLKIKVLMGDKGDNIKAIKPKVGEKTAEKMVDKPELLQELFNDTTVSYTTKEGKEITLGEEYKERYKNNMILIDLSRTPEVLTKALMKSIDEYQLPTGKEIFQYFTKNKFRDLASRMSNIDQIVERVVKYKTLKKDSDNVFSETFT